MTGLKMKLVVDCHGAQLFLSCRADCGEAMGSDQVWKAGLGAELLALSRGSTQPLVSESGAMPLPARPLLLTSILLPVLHIQPLPNNVPLPSRVDVGFCLGYSSPTLSLPASALVKTARNPVLSRSWGAKLTVGSPGQI
jgi:hypothetical protein